MKHLNIYFRDNCIQISKKEYLPKTYVAAIANRFIDQKAGHFYSYIRKLFNFPAYRREGFVSFINENYYTYNDVIIRLTNNAYSDISLCCDVPWAATLVRGLEIVQQILRCDNPESLTDDERRRLETLRFDEVEAYINSLAPKDNCGINQNLFDYVIARESILNNKPISYEDAFRYFNECVVFNGLVTELVNDVQKGNEEKCLRMIKSLSFERTDVHFAMQNINDLCSFNITELFYFAGLNLKTLFNILDFHSLHENEVIPQLFNNFISNLDERLVDVCQRRSVETLEAIGQFYDLTRERVRQIEADAVGEFEKEYFDTLVCDKTNLIFYFPRISSVFSLNSYLNSGIRNKDFFRTMFRNMKFAGDAKYYESIDAVVADENTYSILKETIAEVVGSYVKKTKLDEKVDECLSSLSGLGFEKNEIISYITNEYNDKGALYVMKNSKFNKQYMIEYIFKNNFDDGFHISDLDDFKKLNVLAIEEFGIPFTETSTKQDIHSVEAILGRANCQLVDRGTYAHKSKVKVLPQELIYKIVGYINIQNKSLGYSDIYETFLSEMNELGIKNKYELQGCLSEYKDVLFSSARDYLSPLNQETTLRETMIDWMKSQTSCFNYDDFVKEFKGAASSVFISCVYELGYIRYWNQRFISPELVQLTDSEEKQLLICIEKLLTVSNCEFCSVYTLYKMIVKEMPSFCESKYINFAYDLFSYLQVMLPDKYRYQRPLIGRQGCVFNSSRLLAEEFLQGKKIAKLNELRKYIDMRLSVHNIKYYTLFEAITDNSDEFVLIDSNTIISKDTYKITEREIVNVDSLFDILTSTKDEVSIDNDVVEAGFFTTLGGLEVNRYLLLGILISYVPNKYDFVLDHGTVKKSSIIVKKK